MLSYYILSNYIPFEFYSFYIIGKLHTYPMGSKPTTLASTWEKEVPFEP